MSTNDESVGDIAGGPVIPPKSKVKLPADAKRKRKKHPNASR